MSAVGANGSSSRPAVFRGMGLEGQLMVVDLMEEPLGPMATTAIILGHRRHQILID